MPTPLEFKSPFLPDAFYHLTCKSIDGVPLFINSEDYQVYKQRFKKFSSAFVSLWSYALLKNHSHGVLKINSVEKIVQAINSLEGRDRTITMSKYLSDPENEEIFDAMLERQMNSFMVSYVNYFNTKYDRKGGLFQKPFKRFQIHDDAHLQQALIYVNANAQKHKIITDFKKYPYSSYSDILDNNNSFVDVNTVLNFFDGRDKFIAAHQQQVDHYYKNSWPSSKLE